MPIEVTWDNDEKTVIRYSYIGHWNWNEYNEAVLKAYQLYQEVSRTVNVIADFTQSHLLPDSAMSNFRKSLSSRYTIPFGITVLIINNEFMARMINLYRRLYSSHKYKLSSARSLDEAREIIKQFKMRG